jgi:hypothetical protein
MRKFTIAATAIGILIGGILAKPVCNMPGDRAPRRVGRDCLTRPVAVPRVAAHFRDRRLGRDFGPENLTEPGGGRPIARRALASIARSE